MINKKVKYSEGDLFIIKLDDVNKVLGLIVRRRGRTKVLLGYFWKFDFEINDNLILDKSKAILITMYSGLGYEIGTWQILGKYGKWNRDDWEVPELSRFAEETIGLYFADKYNDDLRSFSERRITKIEAERLYRHSLHGYISLENALKKKIGAS